VSDASLNGSALTGVRIQVPSWGCWWADVDCVATLELEAGDTAALDLGGQRFMGTVVSGGVVHARSAYRVVGGHGGWGRAPGAQSYRDDSGVRHSKILNDVAAAVGEQIAGIPTARTGGRHFARDGSAPASQVLSALYPRDWYVDFDGVTQIWQRAATTYTSKATRLHTDKRIGVVELAPETLEGLVPGVTVDGVGAAVDVEYEQSGARLTVRCYASADQTRLSSALARVVQAADPYRRYRACYEFRVVSVANDRANLQPVRASSGFDDLLAVPIRGPFGIKATVLPGATVVVAFVDAHPSRPFVIAGPAWDEPGWMPVSVDIGPDPRLGCARLGDAVQAGPWPGVITSASTTTKVGA
jgi:hypothetical protein